MITKLLGMQIAKVASLFTFITSNFTTSAGDTITDHNGNNLEFLTRQ